MVGQGKQTSAERRRERAAAARKAAARRSHRLRLQAGGAVAAVLLVGGGAYGAITVIKNHHDSAKPALDAAFSPAPTPNQAGAPPGKANCVYVNTPAAETGGKKVTPPPSVAEAVAPYYAEVLTDHGTVEIELDSKAAPCAVNSFVSLANQGFYDNTICHRLLDQAEQQLTYAVLQCGDPTGTGKGGPGYKFADENLTGARYSKGVIAMANAGPNTNGSQFFMMFKDSNFDPSYTPFGRILAGLDVIEGIARGGVDVNSATGSNDVPKTKTTIQKVTITTTPPSGVSTAPPQASSTPTPISTSAGTNSSVGTSTSAGTNTSVGTSTGTTGTAIPNKGSSTTPKNLGPATPKP